MAASLLAVSLLTGCGSSSLVQKGIEQADVSYNDGSEPLKAQGAAGNDKRSISESQQQWIRKFLEVKKECLKQGVIRQEEEVGNSLKSVAYNGLKAEEIGSDDQYMDDVYADGKEKLVQFTKALEEAGFYGTEGVKQLGVEVRSRGLLFTSYDATDTEDETVYDISISVMGSSVAPSGIYNTLAGQDGSSAFSLIDQIQGGYYEYYAATGDYNNGETSYYNGIQMYVTRQENRVEALAIRGTARESKAGTQPFSKEQKAVLKRLIANYTGDAKGADQFVENFRLDGDSHGTIGNKKWRLGTGKDYNEMPAYKINFS
mgnify:FL=1